jgi:hypothetical protein
MTTTASGLLCWRDFHPQEWQLASLHWSGRASQEVLVELAVGGLASMMGWTAPLSRAGG